MWKAVALRSTKNVRRQFLFAFFNVVWYTDKVFAPET